MAEGEKTNQGAPERSPEQRRAVSRRGFLTQEASKAGMEAVAPVQWNDSLFLAAAAHSRDMAQRDYFDHASPEGGRVGARATAEGYRWRMIGENIAGGDRKLEGVMAGWLHSEGHCHNIMRTEFTDFALACVHRDGTTWGPYWTMVLGRPQVRARP